MFLLLYRSSRTSGQTDDDDEEVDTHICIHNSLLDALLCYDGVTKNENEKKENFLPNITNVGQREREKNEKKRIILTLTWL